MSAHFARSKYANREAEVALELRSSLSDLTTNSKPLITMLTIVAQEHIEYAAVIVRVMQQHVFAVPPEFKLPILYLIDSILKNVRGEFVQLFGENIISLFCNTFERATQVTRDLLYALRYTWKDVFPNRVLYDLDMEVRKLDSNWPILAQEPQPAIHVNPDFLRKLSQEQLQKQQQQQIQATGSGVATPAGHRTVPPVALPAERAAIKRESRREEHIIQRRIPPLQEDIKPQTEVRDPPSPLLPDTPVGQHIKQELKTPTRSDGRENQSAEKIILREQQHSRKRTRTQLGSEPVDLRTELATRTSTPNQDKNFVDPSTQLQPIIKRRKKATAHLQSIKTKISPHEKENRPPPPVSNRKRRSNDTQQMEHIDMSTLQMQLIRAPLNTPLPTFTEPKPPLTEAAVLPTPQVVQNVPSAPVQSPIDVLGKAIPLDLSVAKPSRQTAIQDVDLSSTKSFRTRQDAIVTTLYSGSQCSNCGVRFPSSDHLNYREHLDWHFQNNRRERDATQKCSRQWYLLSNKWTLNSRQREDYFGKDISAVPDVSSYCSASSNDAENVCYLCREGFEQYFNDDMEEWQLRYAVRVDDRLFHPQCKRDYIKKRSTSTS